MKPIGELCDIIGGGTPPKSNAAFFNGSIPWATVRDMKADWIEVTEHSITPEAVKQSATHILPSGSVVIASRVGLGKVCRVSNDTAINQDLRGFVPKPKAQLDIQYLFWWFKSVAGQIVAAGNGATVQGVTLPFLRSLEIPLPPLDEQRRIVAVLDKAFAGTATATANAQKNLTNARALFEGSLRTEFILPTGDNEQRKVGDLLQLQRGFDITKSQQSHGSFPVISSGGIKSFHSEAMVKGPGVIIGRKGTLGKVFYVESDYWPHDTTLWVKDFKSNHPRLVYYMLQCLNVKSLDTGTANPALNRNLVHELEVFWPKGADQPELASRLDRIWEDTQRLAANLNAKLTALTELKQSLLQKAFAGELT